MSAIEYTTIAEPDVSCTTCQALCCRLEVLLISDTGVPERFIAEDQWGGRSMARLDDGWCAALDRNTMLCRIYAQRPDICRDFALGGRDCLVERGAASLFRSGRQSGASPL